MGAASPLLASLGTWNSAVSSLSGFRAESEKSWFGEFWGFQSHQFRVFCSFLPGCAKIAAVAQAEQAVGLSPPPSHPHFNNCV